MGAKQDRQQAILRIIKENEVLTQDELTSFLRREGFEVTQATVSRDIRELQLYKIRSSGNKFKYDVHESRNEDNQEAAVTTSQRLNRILAESVLSVASSGNLVVIKTLSASANGACEAIDSMCWSEVIGTLAGENTILLVIRSQEEVQTVVERVQELVK